MIMKPKFEFQRFFCQLKPLKFKFYALKYKQ